MGRLIFFVKSIIITLVLAAIMQIDINNQSIENHFMKWVATSPLLEPLKSVAQSASKGIMWSWQEINAKIGAKLKGNLPTGEERLQLKLERSKEFIQEQTKKAKQKAHQLWDNSNPSEFIPIGNSSINSHDQDNKKAHRLNLDKTDISHSQKESTGTIQ
ncbi:MAG: hypothetical protein KDD35_02965 [Bdellovibrionales bacterium]|nr:hypothetical protein [Bdellovibrionales bacterium]